jgi:hypothetical protein
MQWLINFSSTQTSHQLQSNWDLMTPHIRVQRRPPRDSIRRLSCLSTALTVVLFPSCVADLSGVCCNRLGSRPHASIYSYSRCPCEDLTTALRYNDNVAISYVTCGRDQGSLNRGVTIVVSLEWLFFRRQIYLCSTSSHIEYLYCHAHMFRGNAKRNAIIRQRRNRLSKFQLHWKKERGKRKDKHKTRQQILIKLETVEKYDPVRVHVRSSRPTTLQVYFSAKPWH